MPHGPVLCTQTRGHRFPQLEPTELTIVRKEPKNQQKHTKSNIKQNTNINKVIVSEFNCLEQSLNIVTTNAADLRKKTKSLKNILNHFKASIFSVQETIYRKKGKYSQDNFHIFEAIRRKEGGGSMLGVHVSLKPVLISEYSDSFELLVVEVMAANKCIRIITGYGPQETWEIDVKMMFFYCLKGGNFKGCITRKICNSHGRP